MSQYTKLFPLLLTSSVWDQPDHVRIVWITMLAMKDIDGVVESSVPGLARLARLSRDQTEDALRILSEPDPDSRTAIMEGRRIVRIDGGWRLVTADIYAQRASLEERRMKDAERARRRRDAHRVTGEPDSRPGDIDERGFGPPSEDEPEPRPRPSATVRSETDENGRKRTHADSSQIQPESASVRTRPKMSRRPSDQIRSDDLSDDPDPPNRSEDPDGEDRPATVCPLDMVSRLAPHVPRLALAYSCREDAVRDVFAETAAYWTIGPGTGKRNRNWAGVFRRRLHELAQQGRLPSGSSSAAASSAETAEQRAKRLAREKQDEDRIAAELREIAARKGLTPDVQAARETITKLARGKANAAR